MQTMAVANVLSLQALPLWGLLAAQFLINDPINQFINRYWNVMFDWFLSS